MITRVTHTLLSSWDWAFRKEDGLEDFRRTLRREKTPPTSAMQDGIRFEEAVRQALRGNLPRDDDSWYWGVMQTAEMLAGSASQVWGERQITVDGYDYNLQGVADNIKASVITDTKFTRRYNAYGRYWDSSQHPAYFYLWPEARMFRYLIFDGHDLYHEDYYRFDTTPIAVKILQFRRWLHRVGLIDEYLKFWRA